VVVAGPVSAVPFSVPAVRLSNLHHHVGAIVIEHYPDVLDARVGMVVD